MSAAAVAGHYGNLLDGYVVDAADAQGIGAKVHIAPTLMTTLEDRDALARTVLDFADRLK